MLLAAGRGERMGALTADRPKPLLEVGGRSLIDRQLARLAAAGIDEVVVNLSWHGEQIRAALVEGSARGLAIEFSQEPDPPLETGGGIVHALPLLGCGPFLLVNADVLTDFELRTLIGRHTGPKALARPAGTLVLVPNPAHNPNGDFAVDRDDRLVADGPRLTYGGIAVLDTAMFAGLAEGRRPLKPILDAAIERRELTGIVHEGVWLDVGTPERLAEAEALLTS